MPKKRARYSKKTRKSQDPVPLTVPEDSVSSTVGIMSDEKPSSQEPSSSAAPESSDSSSELEVIMAYKGGSIDEEGNAETKNNDSDATGPSSQEPSSSAAPESYDSASTVELMPDEEKNTDSAKIAGSNDQAGNAETKNNDSDVAGPSSQEPSSSTAQQEPVAGPSQSNTSMKRKPAPLKGKSKKKARKAPVSDESSSSEEDDVAPENLPPLPDITEKMPEELLQSLYKRKGVLLISGMVSWDLVAKRDGGKKRTHPNLYTFHRLTDRRYRLIASSCSSAHSALIGENGEAYTFGRNTYGQLGVGDKEIRSTPTLVPALEGMNCIHAAVGRHHTLFVTDTGQVYACGDNRSGQCGIGTVSKPYLTVPQKVRHTGAPVVRVGCGAEFSMILDMKGNLHSFGMPEYGQLGHNTDGKYFVTSNKLSFSFETVPKKIAVYIEKNRQGHVSQVQNVEVVDFACGNNHTVAIDSAKRVFSWGFGGFGRLGHAEQRDESVPRLIKYFDTQGRSVRAVYCGATYSLAVNDTGTLFLFGQTKRSGEANMYPKPVQDLTGWSIRCVGASNTSILLAADQSLVAWGVSPTYGELGTGEICKSTARPREVPRMDGLAISQVTMGYSHTLLLCDDTVEGVSEKLEKMPVFNP